MATNQALRERIERLEWAMSMNGLCSGDTECECCGALFVDTSGEGVRCSSCCSTCYRLKGSKEWVQGSMCPSKRKQQS